ncbi:MAG: DUF6242 domain-containing protein [Paludibacteraceae bacterium]|nr:DUF6242 domain-containing protein [Paludibacteraceae bacterium]
MQNIVQMNTFSKYVLVLLLAIGIAGCEKKTESNVLSTVARITAFAFAPDDSIPGLGEAIFVVDQMTDTGIIRMRKNDSVRFGTPVNAVQPRITYYSTPASVTFYLGDSAVSLTGYDTLDLSIKPIKIHVVAQNTDYDKWYKLDFNVHKVNGDLFVWETVNPAITSQNAGQQKAIEMGDVLYYFINDGFRPRMFISEDWGEHWDEHTLSGLPSDCNVRQIVEGIEVLVYGDGKNIYYSTNGYDWQSLTVDMDIMALYMCFNDYVWMSGKDEQGKMRLYRMDQSLTITPALGIGLAGDTLPADFPVQDYATIPFTSSSLHQHALIAGGYDRDGKMSDGRWSLEYNYIYGTYHLVNMASEKNTFPAFAGAGVCYYSSFLYMIGGIYEDRTLFTNVYTSFDEGMHWTMAANGDSKKPAELEGRHRVSTFVRHDDGSVYVIGGEDYTTTYSDVYRGRMNSIGWEPIGN